MTRLLEDMSAQKTPCPTKCLSSLGTTFVVGLSCLMSGCCLLHTANQSNKDNCLTIIFFTAFKPKLLDSDAIEHLIVPLGANTKALN